MTGVTRGRSFCHPCHQKVEVGQVESQELIRIGRIIGTHGYKGTVKVEPLTDFPQRFNDLKKVKLSHGDTVRELSVEMCSMHQGRVLIKFSDIDTMEAASQYRNAFLNVAADELYPLPDGYYYHFQLIGMKVYDLEKGYIGQLTDVMETGANDVYIIKSENYGEVLIPAIKEVIMEVDLNRQTIQVKLLPGLLEINSVT